MRYAVNLEKKKVYKIDAGMQCMVDAECIDPDEADQFVLDQLEADVIVEADSEVRRNEKASSSGVMKLAFLM
jgi:U3 small nucleolar RNA-associated protein 14